MSFVACSADVLDNITFQIAKLLVSNEIPYLNLATLVVGW
jgi:hypothetical protein